MPRSDLHEDNYVKHYYNYYIQTAVDQAESHAGKLKLKGRNACMVVAEKDAKLMACCISWIGAFQLSSISAAIYI